MNYLILGCGYSGAFLQRHIVAMGHEVTATSRSRAGMLRFELEQESTWENLPHQNAGTFMTLAVSDAALVEKFISRMGSRLGKVVFLGTTSAFLVDQPDQIISEDSALDMTNPRTQAEQLLIDSGAICVRSAGIYGPARSPLDWIERGRVTPNQRYVNFIHVEDLAAILWQVMLQGSPGAGYLASDGQPMRWSELFRQWQQPSRQTESANKASAKTSKRVDSAQTLQNLGLQLKYRNVVEGVASLSE